MTAADFIRLPITPDLIRGGIAYTTRVPRLPPDPLQGALFARLRRLTAHVAAHLAWRRYLDVQGVPFAIHDAAAFTLPDWYDISLGGRRCDLTTYLIARRSQIADIRRDPSGLLRAPALIASDQFAAETHRDADLLVFGFLLGLEAINKSDQDKARRSGLPFHFVHPMPSVWSQPPVWAPLHPLTLKSECDTPLAIELSGQDGERKHLSVTLHLPPRTRILVTQPFYSLAYVQSSDLPAARIGIHSPLYGGLHLVEPSAWGNIWIYGMEIILTGYITRGAFRRQAQFLLPGARVFQSAQTRVKTLAVPMANLHPIAGLLAQVKSWQPGR